MVDRSSVCVCGGGVVTKETCKVARRPWLRIGNYTIDYMERENGSCGFHFIT